MKKSNSQPSIPVSLHLAFIAGFLPLATHAAPLIWDTTIAADAIITDGSGTWTTAAGDWNDGVTSVGIVWTDGDTAFIGGGTEGTAGLITLGSDITTTTAAEAITFSAPFDGSYTLDTSTFTLTTGSIKLNGGSAAVTIQSGEGGSLALNATNTWSITNGPLTVDSQITGAFGINKFGAGNMYLLNDTNSFTGNLAVNNGGQLFISSIKDIGVASTAGAGDTISVQNNGKLVYTGTGDSTNRTLGLGSSGSKIYSNGTGALVFAGSVTNPASGNKLLNIGGSNTDLNEIQGVLANSAGGTLSISKDNAGTWVLSGANTYTGTTKVTNGTLIAGSTSAFGINSKVTVNDTLRLNGNSNTLGGLNGTGTVENANVAGATLSVGGGGKTGDFSGVLQDGAGGGALALTKLGTDVQTLSGANTYTGATAVDAGSLIFANKAARSASTTVTAGASGTVGLGAGGDGVTDYSNADIAALFNTNTLAGFVMNASSGVVIDTSAGDFTQSTALTGPRNLTKLGGNTLTLSGVNTYTGATTVDAGTLVLINKPASATVTAAAGSSLGLGVGGDGVADYSDADVAALYNANTLAGYTLDASSGMTLDTSAGDFTQSTALTAARDFTKQGDNTLILSAANTYTGTTTLAAGTLRADFADVLDVTNPLNPITTSGALGAGGNIAFAGGTLQYTANSAGNDYSYRIAGGTSAMTFDTNGEDVTLAASLAGNTGLTKLGAGQLTAQWDESYNGITTVDGGTLVLVSSSAANKNSNSTGFQINNGSTLKIEKGVGSLLVNAENFTFDSAGGGALELSSTGQTLWRNNTIVTTGGSQNTLSGTSLLNMQNTRTTTFNVAAGSDAVDLLVSVDFERGFLVKQGAGTVALTDANNDLLNTNTITIEGGVFEVAGGGRIKSGNFGGAVINDGIYRHSSSANQTLFGVVSGTGTIEQTGSGTLTLSGVNSYTGTTTVSSGALFVNGSLGATDVSVASGTILGGTGSIAGTLDFDGASIFNIVDIGDELAVTGNVTFGSGFGLDNITGWDFENADAGTYTLLIGSNIDFTNLDNVGIANALTLGNGNQAYFQNGSLQVVISSGAPAGFAGYITGSFANGTVPGGEQGPDDDWDNDGTSNLLEYALDGFDPTVSDAPAGSLDGLLVTYTKRVGATGITYSLEESSDLGIIDLWTPATPTTDVSSVITYTLTAPTPTKNFVRLVVIED